MLIVFRSVLPAPFTATDAERGCGNADVGAGVVGGLNVVDGVRSPLLGPNDLAGVVGVAIPPAFFRVLATGRAGSAIDGGPGRGGFGSVVILNVFTKSPKP